MINHISTFIRDLLIAGCNTQLSTLQKVIGVLRQDQDMSLVEAIKDEDIYLLGGVRIGKDTRASDDDIAQKNYFFLDFDIRSDYVKKTGGKITDITDEKIVEMGGYVTEKLKTHDLLSKWRYVIFTGNGIQVYYFRAPTSIESKRWWSLGVDHMISEAFKCVEIHPDPGCKNVGRISRMPGSYNNKHGRHVLVQIIQYQQEEFPIGVIQKIGAEREKMSVVRTDAPHPEAVQHNPDSTRDVINQIPIGSIVCELMGWAMAKDGRHFVDPATGKEKACFISDSGNFLIHGGTDHLPPTAAGYSVFEFVKTINKFDSAKTFDWFKKKFLHVMETSKRELALKKEASFPFIGLPGMVDKAMGYLDKLDPNSIYAWGYKPLDDHLGGIYPSEVVMIGGESGTGKTSFLTSVLKQNAKKHKVIFFSLEDTLTDYTLKQVWFEMGKIRKQKGKPTNYPWKEFRNNMITALDYKAERKEAEDIVRQHGQLSFYDRGHEDAPDQMNVETLVNLIEKAVARGYKLFGIDHLHFFNMEVTKSSKADRIEEIMQRIKSLADKHEIAIILLAHYKKLMGEKPSLDSFKDSSSIVQTANVVINMWRDRSDDLGADMHETHFMMPKVRSPVGEKTITMRFNPYTFEYEYVQEVKGTHQELGKGKQIELLKAVAPKPFTKIKTFDRKSDDLPF